MVSTIQLWLQAQVLGIVVFSRMKWTILTREQKDTGPKAALARPIGKVMGILGARTPMDAAELLESTLLHEMTHAVKSNTQSVGTTSPNSVSTCNDNGGKSATYGWENCVALSPFGPKPNPRGGSTTNADSYAIFGLGMVVFL